jgi:serine protease Do
VVSISTVQIVRDYLLRPLPVEGMGSGVIIDGDGLIVTNFHVVGRTQAAQVILNDGRRFDAEVVGGDPSYDIAIIKIPVKGARPANLGDSDKLKVGQIAIAMGSPLGLILGGPTVTVGVISALRRKIQTDRGVIEDLIQTDAPINPGNSGGPLLDTGGNVIGINTAIIPYAQGIGFAIPINQVKEAAEQLIRFGRISKPWLGIYGLTISPQIADYYALPTDQGVLVVSVTARSPADLAGIVDGDIITKVDDLDITSVESLKSVIERRKPGQVVMLEIIREDRRGVVPVTLREQR